MRKLFTLVLMLAFVTFIAGVTQAQSNSVPPQLVFATAFNNWALPSQGANNYSFITGGTCPFTNPYTGAPYGFSTHAPVRITDLGTPASSETVAVSAVAAGGCTFTPTSPASHTSFTVSSGTAGLQEAIDTTAGSSSHVGTVLLDTAWWAAAAQDGTPATIIANAYGSTSIAIADTTAAPWTWYAWNGSNYIVSANVPANLAWLDTVTATSATPGTARAITGLMKTSNAAFTTGNLVGVRGNMDVPVGTTMNATGSPNGYAYGAQGKLSVEGVLNGAGDWAFGLVGQLDVSTGTLTSAAYLAPIWGDFGATAPSGACSFCSMLVLTNTTAAILGQAVLINASAATAFSLTSRGSAMLDASSTASGAVIGHILVTINGTPGVIRVYTGS